VDEAMSHTDDDKMLAPKRIVTPTDAPQPQLIRPPASVGGHWLMKGCGHLLFWIGAALSLPGAALAEVGARMVDGAERPMSKDAWRRR
jgi:hypothetical protein